MEPVKNVSLKELRAEARKHNVPACRIKMDISRRRA